MSGIIFTIPYNAGYSESLATDEKLKKIAHAIGTAKKRQAKDSIASIVSNMVAINIKTKTQPIILNVVNNIMLAARMEGKYRTRSIFADWQNSSEEVIEIQTESSFF